MLTDKMSLSVLFRILSENAIKFYIETAEYEGKTIYCFYMLNKQSFDKEAIICLNEHFEKFVYSDYNLIDNPVSIYYTPDTNSIIGCIPYLYNIIMV
ncbi:MAG: hypothetical protein BAJALOKI3v1_50018 [Promethearchaeota archaeon]|nr:MAG: hypothetical protein BAJALOKI3v1_50018 [Candidatus Lokiarchaeota archaeon]